MSDTAAQSRAPRIAIKFGASSARSEPSSGRTNRPKQPSALGKRRRPNALNHDSDSDGVDDTIDRHETITTLGSDTTPIGGDPPVTIKRNKEYVISSQKNRDWKADIKTRREDRATPSHPSVLNNSLESAPASADQETPVKWGLNISQKSPQTEPFNTGENVETQEINSDASALLPQSPRDADKDAMDALLDKRGPAQRLIINGSVTSSKPKLSEEGAYLKSIQEASEVSTVEEYSEIPEGEFGAAMLRGMGWKGEEFGPKPKQVKRRPHLMGLGSKEDEEVKKGELDKRHGYRERRPRLDEYRREREKEKQERDGRHRDSYKSERDRERRERSHDHRHRDRFDERDNRGHR
ncbi:hypothetical protein GGR50DRAFT_616569 [Xylaria sp. CBS 124048]|nr:hypothetical protein GGR50DRAFT_616569 [Xylaria sp. CBS 124048]